MPLRRFLTLLLAVSLCLLAVFVVHGAGGGIEGKVTDPKGAVIVGATVTVTDTATQKQSKAVTDKQGRYKIEGLVPGSYTVTISAEGFVSQQRDEVKVQESLVPVEVRLEIAPVEAAVKVPEAEKGNLDVVYQKLRQQAKVDQDFAGEYAVVNNLVLKRDAGVFTLRSGELYFLPAVEGRVVGGVFIGDGEFTLTPPTEIEKASIRIFTGEPGIAEQFKRIVFRFSDKTYDEIKSSANVSLKTAGPAAATARDLYRENQQLLRKQFRDNRELRSLIDIYTPSNTGFFTAFIDGKRFNKLVYLIDPFGVPSAVPEEVALLSYGETDGGLWTAFHRESEYKQGTASNSEDRRMIDITRHEIDGVIKGAHITASDRISFKNQVAGSRVVPFELYRTLRVTRVLDKEGKSLPFIQESRDEDADFAVILPTPLAAGETYQLTVHYDGGDALRDSGGGNFILIPRSTWYPGNAHSLFAEDRAIFDMTFRFPKANTFVGTGAPVAPDARDGDQLVARWSSGQTELAVAGFNYGRFKKKEVADKDTGYNVEFYANQEVPNELKDLQRRIEENDRQGNRSMTTLSSISTTGMADSAIADAQNATRVYNAFFGKLPYSRIAMTQQPAAGFGQAWPTLVFMPYFAFIDSTQRTQILGMRGGTDNFWKYVAPHEIAHQWWGHVIGWDSYHDQWMSEGFSEFSASLYVQLIRGQDKFIDFWEDHRKQIVEASPATKGRKPYTVGPVTQGYRLNNGKTGGWIAQSLIYPKGAYILHMLRMMMFETKNGDALFQAMMKDFIKSHFNQPVSTEDFKAVVEKHMTPVMDIDKNGKMDWFFNQWVYGTEVPAYKFEYQIGAEGTLTGRITQSGVSDNFVMLVPIYLDMGKGWVKLGSATVVGNSTLELGSLKLPGVPKRAGICVFNDVLATDIQGGR